MKITVTMELTQENLSKLRALLPDTEIPGQVSMFDSPSEKPVETPKTEAPAPATETPKTEDKPKDYHVVPSVPRDYEEYLISCDYGTLNPTSAGLWGLCEGKWYRVREYYYDGRKERYQKIRDIEVGIIKPENITLKTALKLAQALDCRPEDLTKPDKEESDV